MSNVKLSQSYLMELYNTPSSELPTSELAARINADKGTTLSPKQVQHLFNVQLNAPLKNRPRKQGGNVLQGIEVVMDLNVVNAEEVDAAATNEDVVEEDLVSSPETSVEYLAPWQNSNGNY